jgi:hypothetical protein
MRPEKKGMPQAAPAVVYLNIGGVFFASTASTLNACDYFRVMLQHARPSRGEDGSEAITLFVDRDPLHFRYILNSLRGSRCTPQDVASLHELRVEADFYGLEQYVACVDAALRNHPGRLEDLLASISRNTYRLRQ